MKKLATTRFSLCIKRSLLLILCIAGLKAQTLQAQVSVNISAQPVWGIVDYDYVEYYYIPEADVFYYVPTSQFIYWDNGQYVFVNTLPPSYRVNLYNTYKVVVNEPTPYKQHNVYVTRYAKYKSGGPKQKIIRDSRDSKYYVVKGHPQHSQKNKMRSSGDENEKGRRDGYNSKPSGKSNGQPKQQMERSSGKQSGATKGKQESETKEGKSNKGGKSK